MIIKHLELLNFQAIKEFNADFKGNVYFITGDNELGKSTLLKAISIMLTGERDNILRNGENKGFAKMVVGGDGENYEVELKFTKANPRGTLSIKSTKTGMKTDKVSMLQNIFGYVDFDAVEFSRWSETAEGRRKQVECVKELLPAEIKSRIDEIDVDIARTKEERKEAAAELKIVATICENAEKELQPDDVKVYATPLDISELMEEMNENARLIEKAKTVRSAMETRIKQLAEIPNRIKQANANHDKVAAYIAEELEFEKKEVARIIADAQQRLVDAQKKAETSRMLIEKELEDTLLKIDADKIDYETRKKNAADWLEKYEENNPEKSDTSELLRIAQEHNEKHAKVKEYLKKKYKKNVAEKKVEEHKTKLSNLIKERGTLIEKSKLPVEGLTFTDDGLELNGVQFTPGKVSDSQIMEVATKLIIASNPTIKVFCIARGESLGAKRLQSIIELAHKMGYQGFVEEVRRGQEDLIIEEYSEKE